MARNHDNVNRPRGPGTLGAGRLLAQARREAGVTQAELARRLGISQPAVAQLERYRSNPRVDTLERALRAVGLELTLDTRPLAHPVQPEAPIPARRGSRARRQGS
jgi:transcriptional regulator with XRE-family HTH domain